MMIQEDDQTASDGDMTNNQEMNSDEASMHNGEWTYYLGNMLQTAIDKTWVHLYQTNT